MRVHERLRAALGSSVAPPRVARRAWPRGREVRALDGLNVVSRDSATGPVYVAESRWPLTHRHGDYQLCDALNLGHDALARLLPSGDVGALRQAAFVDVETTGLAGGTGTYVFLTGVGVFEDDSFVLRQFFLADVGSETAMLTALSELLAAGPAVVSFNGRRFDLPLLVTRYTLARLEAPEHGEHLDLLYPAQRLYRRRLESCALGALEAGVLGLRREGDTPGSMAPALYLDYARTGNAAGLRPVFDHNALDVLSLVTLLAHLGKVCSAGDGEAEDYLALGRWDQQEGRPNEAAVMFQSALRAACASKELSAARLSLARLHKRGDRLDEAIDLWQQEADDGTPTGKAEALVELAKVYEHRSRDFAAAEALTRRALALGEAASVRDLSEPASPQLGRAALEHRLARLVRRRARVSER